MASGPLDGIKVLEFTQIIAGPFCCRLLADMGATVTQFETDRTASRCASSPN